VAVERFKEAEFDAAIAGCGARVLCIGRRAVAGDRERERRAPTCWARAR
jgi:hypothetical protein